MISLNIFVDAAWSLLNIVKLKHVGSMFVVWNNLLVNTCIVFPHADCQHMKTKIYRTVILSVGCYGRETWPFNIREEQKLRVFWE